MLLLRLGTGLRPGEAYALRIPDVDLERVELSVTKNLEKCGLIGPTTTGRSRYVPLALVSFPYILPVLSTYIDDVIFPLPNNSNRLLFPTQAGEYLNEKIVYDKSRKIIIPAAGVTHRSPYELRHTFASILINNGEPIPRVAKWLGSKPDTIFKYYVGDTGAETNAQVSIGAVAPESSTSSLQVVAKPTSEPELTLLTVR